MHVQEAGQVTPSQDFRPPWQRPVAFQLRLLLSRRAWCQIYCGCPVSLSFGQRALGTPPLGAASRSVVFCVSSPLRRIARYCVVGLRSSSVDLGQSIPLPCGCAYFAHRWQLWNGRRVRCPEEAGMKQPPTARRSGIGSGDGRAGLRKAARPAAAGRARDELPIIRSRTTTSQASLQR